MVSSLYMVADALVISSVKAPPSRYNSESRRAQRRGVHRVSPGPVVHKS